MTEFLTDLSPSALAVAIRSNHYAFFATFRHSSAVKFHQDARTIRWHTAIPHPWFNGVLCLELAGKDLPQMMDEAIHYFHAHRVDAFTWWLAPHLDPVPFSTQLLQRGFHYDANTPGMALDLADLPAPSAQEIVIRQVTDPAMLMEWARTFIQGYQLPQTMTPAFLALCASLGMELPFRYYLGYLENHPVAASTLFLGAGVAGIYNVATLPEARGHGCGTALTLAPLRDARLLGYHVGVLQSSEMGYPVYQRIGFRTYCQVDHFTWRKPLNQT